MLFAQPCHIVRSCDSVCPWSALFQFTVEQLTQGLKVNHPRCLPSSHACCCADLCFTATGPAGDILLVILLSHFCHICLAGDAGSCLRHLWQIRPPNHMEGWTVPNIWLDPEFGATFTANLLKGTQAILSWFLVLCFPELQFRIVWFSTISVIHHYHLQITGYWVYKLHNHLKSQFLYLSDYDNNHFCSICQCRRHRFDSCSRKISHAADQLRPELQLLSLCSRAHDPQLLKPLRPRTHALQQKNSQQEEACAVQL